MLLEVLLEVQLQEQEQEQEQGLELEGSQWMLCSFRNWQKYELKWQWRTGIVCRRNNCCLLHPQGRLAFTLPHPPHHVSQWEEEEAGAGFIQLEVLKLLCRL